MSINLINLLNAQGRAKNWNKTMITQQESRLKKAISKLDGQQSNDVILALKDADIIRLMRGCTINAAIKQLSKKQSDKAVKKALIELARHDNTIEGVDFMFNTGFGL
jgi:hypothetical protein